MKRSNWAGSSFFAILLALALCASPRSEVLRQVHVVYGAATAIPPASADWRRVDLPFATDAAAAWFRMVFVVAPPVKEEPWVVYLPYLYGGGRLYLNGFPLAVIPEYSPDTVVRWERPHLVPIPPAILRSGENHLFIRMVASPVARVRLPMVEIGFQSGLVTAHARRLFWVRTMSQFTVLACLIAGGLALFIRWRRPEESLYGLFGAAAWLWGIRSMTLVIELMPSSSWHAWRATYYGATGGFVIVMLLFAMRLAGLRYGRLKWVLLAYGLLGPAGYLLTGSEFLIGTVWAGGLVPMGMGVLVIGAVAAWRQRTPAVIGLGVALGVAVLAGIHDYLLSTRSPVLLAVAPQLAVHRLFLLHYAADMLLLVMAGILSARLVGTLHGIERLNRSLEARVADREAALAENYARLRDLERQHAAGEERQQIVRDLHDGVGSQLFLTLSMAEAGRVAPAEIVDALRACIADMRLTFEALGPEGSDFLEAWGNFRFRWKHSLDMSGLASDWELEATEGRVEISPHVILQLLRIVQEALTNVLKHAHASSVRVRLQMDARGIEVVVRDDGHGLAHPATARGRGLSNMRVRARRIGAQVEIHDQNPGVVVAVKYQRALQL